MKTSLPLLLSSDTCEYSLLGLRKFVCRRTWGQDSVLSANIIFFDTFDIMFLPIPVSRCNCLTPACLLSRDARIINAADIIVKRCIYKCCQFIHTDSAKYGIDVAQGEEICPAKVFMP